jgi:nitric oxide reductase NorQ protein
VTRPSGQVHQPRALADMPDVEALRRLRGAGVPALLDGPPSTGKTTVDLTADGQPNTNLA